MATTVIVADAGARKRALRRAQFGARGSDAVASSRQAGSTGGTATTVAPRAAESRRRRAVAPDRGVPEPGPREGPEGPLGGRPRGARRMDRRRGRDASLLPAVRPQRGSERGDTGSAGRRRDFSERARAWTGTPHALPSVAHSSPGRIPSTFARSWDGRSAPTSLGAGSLRSAPS